MNKILVYLYGILVTVIIQFSLAQEFDCELYLTECMEAMSNAVDWANSNGVRLKFEKEGAYTFQLIGIKNNKPVYIGTDNYFAGQTISTDLVQPGSDLDFNLTGASITIGLWDAGMVRSDHIEFEDENEFSRVIWSEEDENDLANAHYHATHVAGTLVAKGDSIMAKGMAIEAIIKNYEWVCDTYEMCIEAQENNLILSNHSYGEKSGWKKIDDNSYWFGDTLISQDEDHKFGYYNWKAQEYDEITYQFPFYTIVKSAGNDWDDYDKHPDSPHYHVEESLHQDFHDKDCSDGYDCIASDKTAKNIITVGAIHPIPTGSGSAYSLEIADFSSFGPTDDGRIKPDIVASGVQQFSSHNTPHTYNTLNGTSMAAPNITGSLALIQEYYSQQNGGAYLTSAALKALIIHTADPSADGYGPNFKVGWGLLNTKKAVDYLSNSESNIILGTLSNNQSIEWTIDIGPIENIKVTIVWTDPPGLPVDPPGLDISTSMLVNDLDIRLRKDDIIYYPYILDPTEPSSPPTTGDNSVDNVEQIQLLFPFPGEYTITLDHKGDLNNNSQDFALIMTTGNPTTEVQFINTFNGENIHNSTLSVLNLYGNYIYENINSGDLRLLETVKNYIAKTDSQKLYFNSTKLMHHHWNDDNNSFKLKNNFITDQNMNSQNAIFNNYHSITMKTNANDFNTSFNIQIRDPWYVEPEEDLEEGCIECEQLNHFHTLNDTENPNGEYEVFLDQIPSPFNQNYSIHAPILIKPESNSQIYKFYNWEFTGATLINEPNYSEQDRYQIAIFHNEGDEILARYVCVGDFNDDKVLNAFDIVIGVDFILEDYTPDEYDIFVGDYTLDSALNVLDIIAFTEIILGTLNNNQTNPGSSSNYNIVSKMIKAKDGQFSLALYMSNEDPVRGIQMKMRFPGSLIATGVELSERVEGMTVNHSISDRQLIFLIYDLGGAAIEPGLGQILTIPLTNAGLSRGDGEDVDESVIEEIILAGANADSLGYEVYDQSSFNRLMEGITKVPDKFELHTPYPNPFNPEVTISFSIPKEQIVYLAIYDLSGRLIENILSNLKLAGEHQFTWNGSNHPSGIYFVTIKSGHYTDTQKALLLK